MNRLKTDFLAPTTSFLHGFGSAINLCGRHYRYNLTENPDDIAIGQDWRMVGQDLQDALEKACEELSHVTHDRAA